MGRAPRWRGEEGNFYLALPRSRSGRRRPPHFDANLHAYHPASRSCPDDALLPRVSPCEKPRHPPPWCVHLRRTPPKASLVPYTPELRQLTCSGLTCVPCTPLQSDIESTLTRIQGHKVRMGRRVRHACRGRWVVRWSGPTTQPATRSNTQGVLGVIIVNHQGVPLRSTLDVSLLRAAGRGTLQACVCLGRRGPQHRLAPCSPLSQDALTKQYSDLIPSLSDLARNLVRDLDPQVCWCGREEAHICTLHVHVHVRALPSGRSAKGAPDGA